ncbi:MAG: prepilin-type N-terminal cleavage/methylation domain-containing protein [Planctomycetota bacterium]|jgi:prepilin-type N-terminal cleavage/methylation domain-containing protein
MKLFRKPTQPRTRSGFTLAEVAVTLVVVGVSLVSIVQVLNVAKLEAADTRNQKLANELGRLSLGRVAAGLFQEEFSSNDFIEGTYAEEGYREFSWELLLGDEVFGEPGEETDRFDSWGDSYDDEEDEDEDTDEPYQKVKVRVLSPAIRDYKNDVTLEQWIPWIQVYGEEEE